MSTRVQVLAYSDDVLLVRWHEPGAAGHCEQRWKPGRAVRSGQCALSGAKIVCGDTIFSPGGRAPARAHAMILAAALDRARRPAARPHVQVLERSDTLLLVRWVESGRAHYGEQTWRPARASRAGVCVLSGATIACGDAIFRPSGRPAPLNARAMILAAALEGGCIAAA
ncbi:DUF3331 domain-containing protein [Burkholderia sp. Ac-20353]|nr:DUF3331 domain-containing protein [Burkholderia sp. Ac-20353]